MNIAVSALLLFFLAKTIAPVLPFSTVRHWKDCLGQSSNHLTRNRVAELFSGTNPSWPWVVSGTGSGWFGCTCLHILQIQIAESPRNIEKGQLPALFASAQSVEDRCFQIGHRTRRMQPMAGPLAAGWELLAICARPTAEWLGIPLAKGKGKAVRLWCKLSGIILKLKRKTQHSKSFHSVETFREYRSLLYLMTSFGAQAWSKIW